MPNCGINEFLHVCNKKSFFLLNFVIAAFGKGNLNMLPGISLLILPVSI